MYNNTTSGNPKLRIGNTNAAPILRWAGSKRAILPKLLEQLPSRFTQYIEPFAGSACFFFKINPGRAVIGDANVELIETYRVVKDSPKEVSSILKEMPVSKEDYYLVRGIDVSSLKDQERAARFIYLNRFCFNGLYRTNTLGNFNVPFGAPKNYNIPLEEDLVRASQALRNARIICADFEKVVKVHARAGAFVYLDPPFYRSSERTFREYNARPVNSLAILTP